MTSRSSLPLVLAAVLSCPAATLSTAVGAAAASSVQGGCAELLPAARPAARALDRLSRGQRRTVAALNQGLAGDLAETAAEDASLWLDACGRAFYVDRARRASGATTASAAGTQAGSVAALYPDDQTFRLASRPGSLRTIYLDFDGGTVTGTGWNQTVGQATISVPAYSTDADSSTFSQAELAQIQRAWAIVAEDYAPFDVNVTTADPGDAAIDRATSVDTTYGDRVLVTAGGPVWTAMGQPGGVSYTGVFDRAGDHGSYQPSWVFTQSLGAATGKEVGEAAAHEAGHAFGLSHDGTSSQDYYCGTSTWAPIMGAGYYAPVTQWSHGEYAGANNTEDDIAIIARAAPYVADDVADTPDRATPLAAGVAVSGLVGRSSDVDAFALAASGLTTVTVTPTAFQPDLDVSLTILDAAGGVVTRVNPVAVSNGASVLPSGLDASATFVAPAGGARYTAVVDGGGDAGGAYVDYGSLGPYRIAFTTSGDTSGVVLTSAVASPSAGPASAGATLAPARAGSYYRASLRLASTRRLRWRIRGARPAGVRVRVVSGRVLRVTGRPMRAGTYRFVAIGRGRGATVREVVWLRVTR